MKVAYIIFLFFPFIKFIDLGLGTDLQPFSIGISILVITIDLRKKKIYKPLMYMVPLVIIGLFKVFIDKSAFREVYPFISLFLISYSFYIIFPSLHLNKKKLTVIIYIYLLVGLVQKYLFSNFMLNFLNRGSNISNGGRGVVSLTAEQSYYSLVCIFLIIILEILEIKSIHLKLILIFQIIFLSGTTIGILYLILYLALKFMNRITVKKCFEIIIFLLCLFIFLNVISNLEKVKERRQYMILKELKEAPLKEITTNKSSYQRIVHIYLSIEGSLELFLLPNINRHWDKYIYEKINVHKSKILNFDDLKGEYVKGSRNMSGYGSLVFQLGFFGLYVILKNNRLFSVIHKKGLGITFMMIMFTPVSLAMPYVGVIIGMLLRKKQEKLKSNLSIKKLVKTNI